MKAEPAFYDFEVFRHDWMVVFKTASGQIYKIHNDRQNLKETLKKFTVLKPSAKNASRNGVDDE